MRALLEPLVNKLWYGGSYAWVLLWPLSVLFRGVSAVRRQLYRSGLKRSYNASVPVLIVGNLTVGGAGKTPMVTWLVRALQAKGVQPGVLLRGYGGTARSAQLVQPDSDVAVVGDEALMQARRLNVPVAIGARRAVAAQLLEEQAIDVIICDDGLQHYALARDMEIVMVDGDRGFGNRHLLPSGPLREPVSRLQHVDVVITQRQDCADHANCLCMTSPVARKVAGTASKPLDVFTGTTVHAVTGIGNPQRFFATLRAAGCTIIEHAYPDHHTFAQSDIEFGDELPILMTAKDAVKCELLNCASAWWVDVTPTLSRDAAKLIVQRVMTLRSEHSN